METTKLYSEILEKVNSFGDVICKDENGKDCEAIDDFKYPELALSIEQLLIDKMEGFMNWMWNNRKDIYKIEDKRTELNNKWQYVKRDGTVLYLNEQELIELYLNK